MLSHVHKDFWEFKVKYKTEIMLIFVQNKRALEIQVIPWKGNHTPRKKKQKKKQHEVTPKAEFYLNE
jgi:hypothetical protein